MNNDLPPNWHRLFGSYYVVRTQAGFEHAALHFTGGDWDRKELFDDMVGYPKSYPSLVHFHTAYRGDLYVVADCYHVNKFKEALNHV